MVVHNATIIDAVLGIVKGDIGIRDGRIVGVGKAGNPDIMQGVDPKLRTGPNTTCVHGDFYIVTAGGVEGHAHLLSPQQCDHALAGGTTTMIGMTPGPHFDTQLLGPEHPRRAHPRRRRLLPEFRLPRPRRVGPRRRRGVGCGRRARRQDPRGSRRRPGGDQRVADRRRPQRFRRPSPYRHDQRIRLLRRYHGVGRRADDPYVPRGGRRRRPRAGSAQGEFLVQRHPVVDQPDQPVHGLLPRRGRADDDARPHYELQVAGGCRLRRGAHPPAEHGGGGFPARHGRHFLLRAPTRRAWGGWPRTSPSAGNSPAS